MSPNAQDAAVAARFSTPYLLAVRPVVKALTGRKDEEADESDEPLPFSPRSRARALQSPDQPDRESLSAQIELAQRIVREQPDDALQALRRMLSEPAQIEGKVR